MIPTTQRVPVELWQKILRFAIYVPIFFDCDPTDSYGVDAVQEYAWELSYWTSERHRNAFRRVCSAWNQYLRGFDHRYIRLMDIVHKQVAPSAFPCAIRLYLGSCTCSWCNKPFPGDGKYGAPVYGSRELLTNLIKQYGSESKLEIVHQGILPEEAFSLGGGTSLKTLIDCRFSNGVWLWRARALYNISLQIPQDRDREGRITTPNPLAMLPYLTTLHLTVFDFSALRQLDVPALKYLSVSVNDGNLVNSQDSFCRALRRIGAQLETFYWTNPVIEQRITDDIWSLLPNVHNLQIPHRRGASPTMSHPLRRVRLTLTPSLYGIPEGQLDTNWSEHLLVSDKSDGRVVMLAHYWSQLLFSNTLTGNLWNAMEAAKSGNIALTDMTGQLLSDYILFFVVHRWRCEKPLMYWRDNEYYSDTMPF